jgi:peptide/nickel transport system ATP-binding protein
LVSTLGLPAETSEGPSPEFEVRGLTKNYSIGRIGRHKVVRALSEVDLSVENGEVLGLVGESGSGKTTFARMVAFLERPTAGEILLGGRALPRRPSTHRLREHRRQVQMIFQDPYTSLDPRNSVRYSVARPLRSFGLVPRSAERETVIALLDQVGLVPAVDFLRRYPHELSGGQRQRVGIARALAASPASSSPTSPRPCSTCRSASRS